MASDRKIVRWGVLGTAVIATKVGAAIRSADHCELTAIGSRDLPKANAWAKDHGTQRSYGSYQAVLDDSNIDAVYIPLPTSLHKEWTIRAAQSGKHVLCEKPLAMHATEVREMTAACAANNVQLMDGVFWVHHARAAEMLATLANGNLGALRRVTSAFTFRWDEIPLANIRMQPELGGGSLGDLGYYCILATWWFFRELPQRVFAVARFENGVDYNLSATLWYSGDRRASFDCGFDAVKRQWLEVAGTVKSLVCDDFVLAKSEEKSRYWLHDADGVSESFEVGPCVQQRQMIEAMNAIVRSRNLEPRWPEQSLATMRVVDALSDSAKLGRIVDL